MNTRTRAVVLGYIKFCMDTVIVDRRIRAYPNRKTWMTREVKNPLKKRNTVFRCGDGALCSAARANLKRGIQEAKAAYRRSTGGPSEQQQHQAGVAGGPAHHQLQVLQPLSR